MTSGNGLVAYPLPRPCPRSSLTLGNSYGSRSSRYSVVVGSDRCWANLCVVDSAAARFTAMGLWEAACWGLAGGLAAGLVSLMTAVASAGFAWPWHGHPEQIGPRLFVFGGSLLLGALVSGGNA